MNKTAFRTFGVVLLVALLTLTVSACGGGDDDASPSSTGTPAPAGWKDFSQGPYAGVVRDEWTPFYLDAEQTAQLAEEGLSADTADMLGNLSEQDQQLVLQSLEGASDNTLLVFLDPENTEFASNINVLGCFAASDVPAPGDEVATMEQYGVQAEQQGNVDFMGKSYPLIKIKFYAELDTYQVYPSDGANCHVVITLTVPDSDTSALDDFTQFLNAFRIDYTALQ